MFVVLMAVCFNANAMPYYFYTGLGSSGSFDRGLSNEAFEVGFGLEVYNNGLFGLDLELGYTTGSTGKGKPFTVASKVKLEPVITLPVVVLDIPIPVPVPKPEPEPEPEPVQPPPVTDCGDDFCYAYDAPVRPEAVGTKTPKTTTSMPTIENDIFSFTIKPKIKINDFIWINLQFGADKKTMDGEIKQKIIDKESRSIQWHNGTHFSDDTVTYHVGVGSLFKFNKQLNGYVKGDWYDMSESIDGYDFQTDDVVMIAGLRFLF